MVTAAWPAKRRRYCSWSAASAYFWGSTTHTKASTTSTRRSTSARWSDATESWSGRSSRTSPCRSGACAAGTTWRRGTCSQSSSSAVPAPRLPSASYTAAWAVDVVGRRTPTDEMSSPDQRVEEGRLAAPGGAGQGNDRAVGTTSEPRLGPLDRAGHLAGEVGREPSRSGRRDRPHLGQPVEADPQVPVGALGAPLVAAAHRRRPPPEPSARRRSPASRRSASADAASGRLASTSDV